MPVRIHKWLQIQPNVLGSFPPSAYPHIFEVRLAHFPQNIAEQKIVLLSRGYGGQVTAVSLTSSLRFVKRLEIREQLIALPFSMYPVAWTTLKTV